MLQDDVAALADVVKKLFEQLQQVQRQFQLQLADQQAVIAKQAGQIDALTKNDVKQDRQVDRLTDNVARLEAENKVLTALQENGTGCCTSALLRRFNIVFFLVNCRKFNARSLFLLCTAQEY